LARTRAAGEDQAKAAGEDQAQVFSPPKTPDSSAWRRPRQTATQEFYFTEKQGWLRHDHNGVFLNKACLKLLQFAPKRQNFVYFVAPQQNRPAIKSQCPA
jgi:hypothetical protein